MESYVPFRNGFRTLDDQLAEELGANCDRCGDLTDDADLQCLDDGRSVCSTCATVIADEIALFGPDPHCAGCGRAVAPDDVWWVAARVWCESCAPREGEGQ